MSTVPSRFDSSLSIFDFGFSINISWLIDSPVLMCCFTNLWFWFKNKNPLFVKLVFFCWNLLNFLPFEVILRNRRFLLFYLIQFIVLIDHLCSWWKHFPLTFSGAKNFFFFFFHFCFLDIQTNWIIFSLLGSVVSQIYRWILLSFKKKKKICFWTHRWDKSWWNLPFFTLLREKAFSSLR